MKKNTIVTFNTLVVCSLLIAFSACSDNSSSISPSDCTNLPGDITPGMLDLSYFTSQQIPFEEQYENYKTVESLAMLSLGAMTAGGTVLLAESFILFAQFTGIKPEIDGNTCVWEISFSEEMFNFKEADHMPNNTWMEQSSDQMTITIRATESGGGINWEIWVAGVFEGIQMENFRLITGFTSSDKSTGEWIFYNPESASNEIVYVYEWNQSSATEFTSSAVYRAEGEELTVDYEKNGPENWLTFDGDGDLTSVYWNESTDSGWFEDSEGRHCYQNFINSGC